MQVESTGKRVEYPDRLTHSHEERQSELWSIVQKNFSRDDMLEDPMIRECLRYRSCVDASQRNSLRDLWESVGDDQEEPPSFAGRSDRPKDFDAKAGNGLLLREQIQFVRSFDKANPVLWKIGTISGFGCYFCCHLPRIVITSKFIHYPSFPRVPYQLTVVTQFGYLLFNGFQNYGTSKILLLDTFDQDHIHCFRYIFFFL